jgi:putative endonuclease
MKLAHHYYVYIVQCKDGFYYTGISNNLEKRISEHNEGKDIFSFTYKRRLVTLKYFEHFTDVKQAIAREKQLKGWSRAKKEALFHQDYNLLRELSKARVRQTNAATLRRGSG